MGTAFRGQEDVWIYQALRLPAQNGSARSAEQPSYRTREAGHGASARTGADGRSTKGASARR